MKLDQRLFDEDDEFVEVDIDPNSEDDDLDELVEEFGDEAVRLAYHYIHRHRMYKMRILKASELDSFDVVAFLLIEEEQGLREAEQQAKLKNQGDNLRR